MVYRNVKENQKNIFSRLYFVKSLLFFCDKSPQKYFIFLSVGMRIFSFLLETEFAAKGCFCAQRGSLKGGF